VPLLRAGTTLTPEYIAGLLRDGVNAVYVEDAVTSGILPDDPLTAETRRAATGVVAKLFDPAAPTAAVVAKQPVGEAQIKELASVASLIARDIAASSEAIYAFSSLASADAYNHQHSLNVTVLGLIIARKLFEEQGWVDYKGTRRFDRIPEKLSRLGVGLLLHDVGKLAVPQAILHKQGPLTPDEWEVVRQHPLHGVELLDSELISPLVKGVVRSHHERWDGGGYPDRRKGEDIFHFARIAAVADVFDALTHERPYKPAWPVAAAVAEIEEGAGTAFEPDVVEAFLGLDHARLLHPVRGLRTKQSPLDTALATR
jgi:HD-GYP domain-containing protein (c-di-GMP phosphodiesterase class II)